MTNEIQALSSLIKKSRVHFYKPIQIAEILYRNRVSDLNIDNLESYRSVSKRWRDDVSVRLVGSVCTSSSRFQDNVFDANAIPPSTLVTLAKINRENNGLVEAYIYQSLIAKMNDLGDIHAYLSNTSVELFNLNKLLDMFGNNPGLRRSMDKVYEIVAYALFDSVIDELDVRISISVNSLNSRLTTDFAVFTQKIFGLDPDNSSRVEKAKVFRVGATNANDGGLDLWSNFGPAIQVKHFTVNASHMNSITSTVKAEKFIVVCTDAEKDIISSVLHQAGTYPKVQSIVTLTDLSNWYKITSDPVYKDTLGVNLIRTLLNEFEYEFPSNRELPAFLTERGYDLIALPDSWHRAKEESVNA